MVVKPSFHIYIYIYIYILKVNPGKPNSTHFEILARFGNTKIEFYLNPVEITVLSLIAFFLPSFNQKKLN